ncbi:hypothetical protein CWI38_0472p0020 [Hamiltosporidium tvaerminnensis]|uniref:Uncharacterized protein n=1 Tax=Hamiltosporidium tvaerminnensis TaxID=1176355 RepID=A0A4Q9LX20_9MICR|nr:hypothetical protein CWI38_0472p0020 [Hamiltosporidium tvaerminnensis]
MYLVAYSQLIVYNETVETTYFDRKREFRASLSFIQAAERDQEQISSLKQAIDQEDFVKQ